MDYLSNINKKKLFCLRNQSFLTKLLTAWYPSQLLQAIAEGPLLFFVLVWVWWKPKSAGVIASTFLLLYGVTRVATEVFRQPDDGVVLFVGLSRGQVLSVTMIVSGIILLVYTSRRKSNQSGGFKQCLFPTSKTAT